MKNELPSHTSPPAYRALCLRIYARQLITHCGAERKIIKHSRDNDSLTFIADGADFTIHYVEHSDENLPTMAFQRSHYWNVFCMAERRSKLIIVCSKQWLISASTTSTARASWMINLRKVLSRHYRLLNGLFRKELLDWNNESLHGLNTMSQVFDTDIGPRAATSIEPSPQLIRCSSRAL